MTSGGLVVGFVWLSASDVMALAQTPFVIFTDLWHE